jgi:nucleoside-diphosphate-sugar epimerase
MLKQEPFIELSKAKATWIWTRSYVENIAFAIYLAATQNPFMKGVFNLGDIDVTEYDLLLKLKELSGWNGEILINDTMEDPYNYKQNIQLDSTRFRILSGYHPPVSYEQSLSRTIEET